MNGKVLLAVLLALMLSVSLQPVPAWADDDAMMDQDNPYYIARTGNWSVSSWAPCATGGAYYYAWGSDDSITYETYETADITGEYAVYARWTSHANRNDNARYRIYDGTSTLRSTVNVDQREDGCSWQWLDTIILTNGNMGRVILDNPGATGSEVTIADGVRFVRITKDGDDIQDGSITTADIMNGTVTSADVGFNYAGSNSKGGPATDLNCAGCVSQSELDFTAGTGDITGVYSGTGLSGGGPSGEVTLSANTNYLQRRVSSSCAPGSSIREISSTGTVTCETDNGITSESDPEVGVNTTNYMPVWNGSELVTGRIYDDGFDMGIGTTTPDVAFELSSTLSSFIEASSIFSYAGFVIDRPATNQNGYIIYQTDNSDDWYVGMIGTGSDFSISTEWTYLDGTFLIEKATGDVGIGTPNPQTRLHIKQGTERGGVRLEYDIDSDYWTTYIDGFDDYNFAYNGALKSYIRDTDGEYIVVSDKRLKKNIDPVGDVLEDVLQLKPVRYHFKDNTDELAPKTIGFLAQDVEQYFPEVVDEKDGIKGVSYSQLIVLAIGAIQEQQEKIASLEAEVDALRALVNAGQ